MAMGTKGTNGTNGTYGTNGTICRRQGFEANTCCASGEHATATATATGGGAAGSSRQQQAADAADARRTATATANADADAADARTTATATAPAVDKVLKQIPAAPAVNSSGLHVLLLRAACSPAQGCMFSCTGLHVLR